MGQSESRAALDVLPIITQVLTSAERPRMYKFVSESFSKGEASRCIVSLIGLPKGNAVSAFDWLKVKVSRRSLGSSAQTTHFIDVKMTESKVSRYGRKMLIPAVLHLREPLTNIRTHTHTYTGGTHSNFLFIELYFELWIGPVVTKTWLS